MHARLGKFRVKLSHLFGHQHSLVNNGPVGKAGNVEKFAAFGFGVANFIFRTLADHIKFALKRHRVGKLGVAGHKNLFHNRFFGTCGRPHGRIISLNLSPAEKLVALFLNNTLNNFLGVLALILVGRKEHHPNAVLTFFRKINTDACTGFFKKQVRDLNEDTSPVTRVGFTAAGSTVPEVIKNSERLLNDFVGFLALDVGHKTDAAGIVFKLRVVQALLFHNRFE